MLARPFFNLAPGAGCVYPWTLRTLSVKICFIVLSMFGLQSKTKVVEKIVKLSPISVSFELYVVSPHKNKSGESPPLLLTWKPHLTQPCSGGSRGGAHPPWFWVQIKEKPTGQVGLLFFLRVNSSDVCKLWTYSHCCLFHFVRFPYEGIIHLWDFCPRQVRIQFFVIILFLMS